MPDTPKLKPCPWCGGKVSVRPGWRGGYYIWCVGYSCNILPVTPNFDTEAAVIEAWNSWGEKDAG